MSVLQASVAGIVAVGSLAAGSWMGGIKAVDFLDNRYAPMAAVEDLAWSALKREIRELRLQISEAQNPSLKARLEADLQDTIDRLCKSYPQDRECA